MTTLRRELRQRFEAILFERDVIRDDSGDIAAALADAALEAAGIAKADLPENSDPAWLIAGGVDVSEIARQSEKERREKATADLWEREMGYNPLPWWSDRKLTALLRYLVDCSPDEIHAFADWCKRPFSSFSPAKARQHPELVRELWPQAFGEVSPNPEPAQESFMPDIPEVGAPPPPELYAATKAKLDAIKLRNAAGADTAP